MKKAATDINKRLLQLEEEVQVKEKEMNSLLQITQAINNNISSHGLLRLYETILVKQVGAGKVAVFVHQENWECTNAHGITVEEAEKLVKDFLPAFTQISKLDKSNHPLAKHFDVVVPVYHKQLPLAFTFLGELPTDKEFDLDEKLNYIQTISNVI